MSNTSKKKALTMGRRQQRTAYLFIAIPCIYFIIFKIAPTVFSLYLSVTNWQLLSGKRDFIGLSNFIRIFQDETFLKAIRNTFYYIIITVPLMVIVSLLISLMLNGVRKGKGYFRTLIFIPYVTSAVAVAFIWKWMFMEQGGVMNALLQMLGIANQPFLNSPNQAIYVVMSLLVWSKIGFNSIILLAGLTQISSSYYEAASIDGANKWQTFWSITLPQLKASLVYIIIMNTISTLQVFTQILNINAWGGPLKSTTSIVVEIYLEAFSKYNMGRASAMTVVLFVIILAITIFQMKVLNKEEN